ncbi:MAG: acetyl esterase/lipase [Verrucomicrobiales bacterium]|jgi:acetyl esterase/lipase
MKTIAIFAALALISPAAAQNQPEKSMEERLAAFLKQFPESDGNKDGKLTNEERIAFNKTRRGAQAERERPQRVAPTHADLTYGDHEKQKFDLWLAESKDGSPTPLAIYIHGGGFRGGDKRVSGPPPKYLAAGISYASINYRLSDVGPYPIMMHDAARCLQTIRHRAEEWNLDPGKIVCYGGSAGAGISLWLAFHEDLADPDSDDPIARQSTRILAAGTSNGQSTYDMRTFRDWFAAPNLPPHEALPPFYGIEPKANWDTPEIHALMEDASAITHLTKDDPPVYMIYGRGDVPVDDKTNAGVWVHHVRLGLKLKEAMEAIGLECHVRSPDHKEQKFRALEDFVAAKLLESEDEKP